MHYENLEIAKSAFWLGKENGTIKGRVTKYHFALLQPGDSIFIAHPVDGGKSIRAAASIYARLHGQSFSVKKTEKGMILIRNDDHDDSDFSDTKRPVKAFVPVPHSQWPLHTMAVGDHYHVPISDLSTKSVRYSVHDWGKRNRMGFSVVPVQPSDDNKFGDGTLIFRVR